MEVLSRVPILRVVATTDMPASPAESQMHPAIAELETLFATATTRLIGPHEIQMTALLSHETRGVEAGRDHKVAAQDLLYAEAAFVPLLLTAPFRTNAL
jgi:hypothetical protein